jgi:hypothetical protein
MVNRSKNIGTAAETAVVKYLQQSGFPDAERRALSGGADRGDINVHPDVVIEVKRCQRMELASWLDEAVKERDNAGATVEMVWHWRRRKGSPGEWFVTMTGETAALLLRGLHD